MRCIACPPLAPIWNGQECMGCPTGAILDIVSKTCKSCPPGFVFEPSTTRCVCPKDTFLIGSKCVGCNPPNFWDDQKKACLSCP